MGAARTLVPWLGLALALAIAAPSSAHFPQHIDESVPPSGTASETSSELPTTARSATITVKPMGSGGDYFSGLQTVLSAQPSKRLRVLYCVAVYKSLSDIFDGDAEASSPDLRLLLLAACLEVAFQDQPPPSARAVAAASGCPVSPITAPMKVTHTATGYTVHVKGTVRRQRSSPLVVRCRRTAAGLTIRMRPRSRKRSLRSVVGPKLAVAIRNPDPDHAVGERTTFSVR